MSLDYESRGRNGDLFATSLVSLPYDATSGPHSWASHQLKGAWSVSHACQEISETLSDVRILGYTRVSDASSDAAVQTDALMSAGVALNDVFSDTVAGAKRASERPGIRLLLANAGEGDTVVVWRLDRLGRSLGEVLDTVTMLGERGINLCSLQDGIAPGTTDGHLMLNLLASLAEYDRHLARERIAAGMASAQQAGTRLGRPPVDPEAILDKIRAVEDARARGLTAADAAQLVGWSRATFYRHQQERGSQR